MEWRIDEGEETLDQLLTMFQLILSCCHHLASRIESHISDIKLWPLSLSVKKLEPYTQNLPDMKLPDNVTL